jgi:alkanesulfonate monooxygenase SsuD/methylene tetrahydromethanopterin reductase-like flavin-dependent oxidoreductase (luciferase family)
MYVSLFLGPNVDGPEDDRVAIELCIEQALKADEAGFAAVYVGEQHFNDYEPYSNPIVMAAYLAGQLQQAYLGTSMIPIPLHHPLRLVERMNLLDQLTAGRCIFGISRGIPRPNPAFPLPGGPGGLQQLFEEKLEVMQRAWRHRREDGPLEFHTATESGAMDGRMMPVAYRAGGPLWAIGTNTEDKVRAAGLAGHLVHLGPFGIAGGAHLAGVYRAALEEGGASAAVIARNMSWLITTKGVFVGESDESAAAEVGPVLLPRMRLPFVTVPPEQESMSLSELLECDPGPVGGSIGRPESLAAMVQRTSIVGSPETVTRKLQEYAAAGLEHIHMRFALGSLGDPEPFRRSMDLFIEEVLPRLDVRQMGAPGDFAVADPSTA